MLAGVRAVAIRDRKPRWPAGAVGSPDRKMPAMPTPRASRPHSPGYGIAADEEGLLPWSWAAERLTVARNFFIATTRPDGRPHLMIVDTPRPALWQELR